MKLDDEVTVLCLAWNRILFALCVCCERMRGKIPQRYETPIVEDSLSWVIRVWLLGVNLSHSASEVNRVSTDTFPCNQNQNATADSHREDFACLIWPSTVLLRLLALGRFAEVYTGTRRKHLLLKLCWLPSNCLSSWALTRWRMWFIKPASSPWVGFNRLLQL